MTPTRLDEADGLTAADVTHADFKALPATATVEDVRAWFAASELAQRGNTVAPDDPARRERSSRWRPRLAASRSWTAPGGWSGSWR